MALSNTATITPCQYRPYWRGTARARDHTPMPKSSKKQPLSEADVAAAERLRAIWDRNAKKLGLTQQKAADAMGIGTQGGVGHYLQARIALNLTRVLQFASLLKVDPRDIRDDLEGMTEAIEGAVRAVRVGDSVTMYDAYASAGDGHQVTRLTRIGELTFRWGSLEKKGIDPKQADVYFVTGRSMEPRLYDGDVVLFDKRETDVTEDGKIYVILWNGARYVKRIFRELDGKLRIVSDNKAPEFQDRFVHVGDEGFSIQGRVRWIGSWEA
jgi:phage repressor protein C with HTH and peptisase S24 domain